MVPEIRARLWQREFVDRLIRAGDSDPDLEEWITELEVEEAAAQTEFRNVGVVYAQLSQVEAGVRSLVRQLPGPAGEKARSRAKKLRFNDYLTMLEDAHSPQFVKEIKALKDVRHLRNHFAHGEVRVGVASVGPGAPLEPVIALIHTDLGLPEDVHQADPLRDIVDGDLDVYRAMKIASEGLEALLSIMLATGFSPYAGGTDL
jgi:hypothetical protein